MSVRWADPGTLIVYFWFNRKQVSGFPETIAEAYRFLIGASGQAISERFQSLLRSGDTVARLGGDEFVIVIESCRSREGIVRIAQKLIATIAEPLHLDGHELEVRGSIGIAVAPHDGHDPEAILDAADQAMYRVKMKRGNDFRFFDEGPDAA